jgi:hypothetical protein
MWKGNCVERHLIGQVNYGEAQAYFVTLGLEVQNVIVAEAKIEEMPRIDARRIVVVIFRTRRWNLQQG